MKGLTGSYYWLPLPGVGGVTWEVVTCHQLGFDAETGHVEMWGAVLDQIARAWGKQREPLGKALGDCCYALPRGRVTRPGRQFLVLHGDDAPYPDWLERVLVAFQLQRSLVRLLPDEHERMLRADQLKLALTLDIPT